MLQRNQKFFLLGLMDTKLEKTHSRIALYITMAARLLNAQRWKSIDIFPQ